MENDMMKKAIKMAEKSGTLQATLEIIKTRLEVYGSDIDVKDTIKYIDEQLKKVGE